MNPPEFVMKCLLSSHQFSSPLWISWKFLSVNPANLHAISAKWLKSNKWKGSKRTSRSSASRFLWSWEFYSADQYVNTQDRLLSGHVKEEPQNCFRGGTIFHDAATGLIWTENWVSCGARETLIAKKFCAQWIWGLAATEILPPS